ncbi:MAG TPA: FtsX-like permease family protein [Gaiellaceae bacterium]|nr:FtsX-like permease family protein [Gaiellaceae bacterium]
MSERAAAAASTRPGRWRFTRRAVAPAAVAAARLRARPGRSLLLAVGVAGATAMLVAVLGAGLVAKDRAVQSELAKLPASERSFRVDSFGLPPGQRYGSAARDVRRVLSPLTSREPLAGTFFRELVIDSRLVQLASLDRLAGLVRLRSGRLPDECVPARCEVLQVGAGADSSWRQDGINLVRVGTAEVRDASMFGPWLEPGPRGSGSQPTRLLADGANAFDGIPTLASFYRVYSWIAPIAPSGVHVWQIDDVLARESRAQTVLAQAGGQYKLGGPDAALLAARTTTRVAGQRLNLIGGQISALLLGFALVAAVGLRRGLAAERRRLVQRGANAAQSLLAVGTEIGATTLSGGIVGALGGLAAVVIVALRADAPWAGVLQHGPASASGVVFVLLLWLAATALLFAVSLRGPESSARRRVQILDVLAIGAVGVVVIGLTRGALDAGTLESGNDVTFLLLLPGLVCFAAAVAAARLLGPLMRAAERLTRGGPPALRLAMLALARAPARTAATASFLVVAVGLALFATAYRATLEQGAADEAAFTIPLDLRLTERTGTGSPLDLGTPERFDRIAPGVQSFPVVRESADVPGPGTSVLTPTVLGLPPDAFAGLHWRRDFAALPLSTLAARVGADPPVSLRGVSLPAGAAVSLRARASGTPVQLVLAAETETGRLVLLGLAERGADRLTARTPAAGHLKLIGLEISVATGEAAGLAHRAGESSQAGRIPQGSIVLGPLRARGRRLTSWRGFFASGAALREARGQVRVSYEFTSGQTVLVRRRQATDGRPLRVIASPGIAAAAGVGGALVLDFSVGRVQARIVGVARRFPAAEQESEGFVVADESRLAVALTGTRSGRGRPTELWLAVPAAQSQKVERGLGGAPFSSLGVASRSELEHELAADPLARGISLILGAAALAALVLAVLALWLAFAADLGDERGELLDLEAQGVGPETLRRQFRVRAAVLGAAALVAGGALGLLLSRLVVTLVGLSAGGSTPEPPLRLEAAWALDALGLVGLLLAAAVAVELTTRRAFRGDTPDRPSWSLE